MNLFTQAAKLEQENIPFALAQIVESRGSTPRHKGLMLVLADGQIHGTIGGGMIERCVIEEAVAAITARQPRLFHGRMARNGEDAVGSDCGGAMSVYIDVFGLRPRLILIGAGHVNRALAHAAAPLNFDLHVGDTFADSLAPAHFPPQTNLVWGEQMGDVIDKLHITPDDFVIIATNHQDKEALDKLITQPLAYLGLLASKRKVQTFTHALLQQGVTATQLQQLHAPIGYNIGAETPEEIAISILAELLQVKNNKTKGLLQDNLPFKHDKLVVIRGAGDIATGIAVRLHHCGFNIVMLDTALPSAIRRTVSFAQGIIDGQTEVEGVCATLATTTDQALTLLNQGKIALLVDQQGESIKALKPRYLIDAILAKKNVGTHKNMAPITIALGPGFEANSDCDAVIETNRGHHLGRVIYQGCAQANTGIPGSIDGHTDRRVIRAPNSGAMKGCVTIGALVQEGDIIAHIGNTPISAPLSGMVRGLLCDDIEVTPGFKIGDIDPRGARADASTISDKARAIGGAVLEAMLHLNQVRAP